MNDLLSYYKRLWNLRDDVESFSTLSSILQPVTWKDSPAMLKIALHHEERLGNSLMHWWNGNGSARVLMYDDQAILMEHTMGTLSLVEMVKAGQDNEASRILCDAVAKLHDHRPPYPVGLVLLTEWFKKLEPAAARFGGLFVESNKIANKLLADQRDIVALHGDIHHGNVLDFGGRGWLAIDPKGLIGDPAYETANVFINPERGDHIAADPRRVAARADILAERLGYPRKRILGWAAAHAALSACWDLADGKPITGQLACLPHLLSAYDQA